jgi:ribosome maturation protein SDO1
MSSIVSAKTTVVKYQKLEIICNQGSIEAYREGKSCLDDTLITQEIYKDAKKADRASEADIVEVFQHKDMSKALDEIIKKGDYQISTAERKKKVEEKRKQIVYYFHKNYMDPKSRLPHPITRIEAALSDIKALRIHPHEPTENQAKQIMKQLRDIIPMKSNAMEGTITVPHAFLGQLQGVVRSSCTVLKEDYTDFGCKMRVAFVASDLEKLLADINRVGKGEVSLEFEMDGDLGLPKEANNKKKGKGGKKKKKGKKKA